LENCEIFVVTNNRTLLNYVKVLELGLPVKIETSTPISKARRNCVKNTNAEYVLFVDDDVSVTRKILSELFSALSKDVGAVEGVPFVTGLGGRFDHALNNRKRKKSLQHGDRGYTIVTLVRKELVQDWDPKSLSSYEDYSLTQHILSKGYNWVTTPISAFHIKTWGRQAKNRLWLIRGYMETFDLTFKQRVIEAVKHFVSPFNSTIKHRNYDPFLFVYNIYMGWSFAFAIMLTIRRTNI